MAFTVSLAWAPTASAQFTPLVELLVDGDGVPGQPPVLTFPFGVAVGASGNAYVSGRNSNNVLEITPSGTISEIIDVTGAGLGAALSNPSEMAVDAAGNVYVIGESSDNAFRITPGGTITEIIDPLGDGAGSFLDFPTDIAVDASGNVFVASRANSNVFRIDGGGTVTLVIDAAGAGAGAPLTFPDALAIDDQDNLYVAGHSSNNVLQRQPDGTIAQLIGPDGDGQGNPMGAADALAIGPAGDVYVAAFDASMASYSVWVWRAATGLVEKLPVDSFFIGHLAVGAGGEIFTTSSAGVDEYWPDGTYRRKRWATNNAPTAPYAGPWGLDIDASDGLYTAGRFSDTGIYLAPLPEPGLGASLAFGIGLLALRQRKASARPRRNARTGQTA